MVDKTPPAKRALDPRPRAIVVGASSGTGAALTRRLTLSGYLVAAVARRQETLAELATSIEAKLPETALPTVRTYAHDVTQFAEVPDLFQQIVLDLGGLDLIVYAAAVQAPIEANEYNFAKDEEMINTNLLGAIAWLNQAAMRFDRARRGHIVGISSIAGDRGRVAAPVYNTSKAALNTYLEALRNRLVRARSHGDHDQARFCRYAAAGKCVQDLLGHLPRGGGRANPDSHRSPPANSLCAQTLVRRRFDHHHIPSFIFRRLSF